MLCFLAVGILLEILEIPDFAESTLSLACIRLSIKCIFNVAFSH